MFCRGGVWMPYARNADLPAGVKNALPAEAQSIWRNAFNSAVADEMPEERAFKIAWGAVKNAGWKQDEDGNWRKVKKFARCQIAKIDEEKGLVFGWANANAEWTGEELCLVEDEQGSMIEDQDLEQAAYTFTREGYGLDERHDWERCGYLVESMMVTNEKLAAMFPGQPLPVGKRGWWIGMKPDPAIFAKFKSGEYKGFSIGGVATVEPAEAAEEGGASS